MQENLISNYIENTRQSRRVMSNLVNILSLQERTMRSIVMDSINTPRISDERNYINRTMQLNSPEVNRQRFYTEIRENRNNNLVELSNWLESLNLDNVSQPVVRPTPTTEEINLATRQVLFSSLNNPVNNICPISRDVFQPNDTVMQIIPCGHVFTRDNLQTWFRSSTHCPMCRYDIRNYQRRQNVVREQTRQTTNDGTPASNSRASNSRASNSRASNPSASNSSNTNSSNSNSRTSNSSNSNSSNSNSRAGNNLSSTTNIPTTTFGQSNVENNSIERLANMITRDIFNQIYQRDLSSNLMFEFTLPTAFIATQVVDSSLNNPSITNFRSN